MIDIACDPRHFANQRDSCRKNSDRLAAANTLDYPSNTLDYPFNTLNYPSNTLDYSSNTLDYPLNSLNYHLNPNVDQNACSWAQSPTFTPEMKYQSSSTKVQSSNSNQANLRITQPPNHLNSGATSTFRYFTSYNSQNSQTALPYCR